MKKVLIASVVTVGMALPAAAADMATKAPIYKAPSVVAAYDWSGFYIGANGGFAWSEKCWFSVNQARDEGCHNPSGGIAGGQLGYNWQFGNFVVGVEGTGDWSDFSAGRPSVLNPAVTLNSNVNGIFTAAARVGGAWNNWLFYGKGGAAWVRDNYNEVFLGQVATVGSETRSGWLAGVGTEVGITNNLSVGVEYDYAGLGTTTVRFSPAAPQFTAFDERIRQNLQTVTVRLNYRWGGPVVAKY
jgi:outer membrane immunogenic protein